MNWTLEVVVIPVTDLSRAKAFYADQLGFRVDHDTQISPTSRIVQLTPPGSGCSIVLGTALNQMAAGSLKGLQLVVNDIRAAHAELVGRGVTVSDVSVIGAGGRRVAQHDEPLNYVGFVFFSDPDGNSWAIQQINSRP